MPNNIILGGGLTALMARDILGPTWKIIPFGGSLYYSFNPPIWDNYIYYSSEVDEYLQGLGTKIFVKTAFSISGQLTTNHSLCLDKWLHKVYGNEVPPQTHVFWSKADRIGRFAQGYCDQLYRSLQRKYAPDLLEFKAKALSIGDHTVQLEDRTIEYGKMISTIPLPVLCQLMGKPITLPSRDLYCYHLATDQDLENNDHILVVDEYLEFFKCSKIKDNEYIFYSTHEIVQPGRYFMSVLKKFELLNDTKIPNSIACGPIPSLDFISSNDITLMGSSAVWDDCLDIGSCLKRLIKMA